MNFKDLYRGLAQGILFGICFVMIRYLIERYTNTSSETTTGLSGQSFVAPEVQKSQRPLLLDVVFEKEKDHEIITTHKVVTPLATYTFSSRGAILESFDLLWQNKTMNIPLVSSTSQCFLLALDGASPLYYDFVKEYSVDGAAATAVEYSAPSSVGRITKTFIVYHDTYRIDVKIAIQGNVDHIRLMFPMPVNLETGGSPMGTTFEVEGIANKATASNQLQLRTINLSKQLQEFVFEPKVFGFSDRFVVQAFVDLNEQKPLRSYFKQLDPKNYQAILESDSFEQGSEKTWSFYFGPKVDKALLAVLPALEQTIDYGWFAILAKPMFKALQFLKDYCGNYGIAIILLTIFLNLLLLPFRMKGERSMRQQADFQKKLAYLRQKYKHDKQALDAASAELIQKHGMPGFLGCLPMLLNIPFFVALSRVLSCSFDLYGAHFLWLPDLSAKDPFYILGILTCVTMLATPMGDSKQSAMRYGSALMFGTITMYLSSGLALFILVNTFLSLLQAVITRRFRPQVSVM